MKKVIRRFFMTDRFMMLGINKIEGADDVKDIMKKAQQTGT